MQYDSVKDSGERQEFDTGAVRDTQHGKGRPDLLSPYALMRLCRHFENGAVKYGDRNWEKGIPLARYMESIFRHWCAYLGGDRSEDHLAAMEWNTHCMMQTEQWIREGRLPASLDTLPNGGMDGRKESQRRL